MHYLENVFFWASQGCPDAIPAGIIAVDLGLNEADLNDAEIKDIRNFLCEECFFDDMGHQLGFTMEDIDLIRRDGDGAAYLTGSQVVSDWQWELIKKQPGLRVSEHNLEQHCAEMEKFIEEDSSND